MKARPTLLLPVFVTLLCGCATCPDPQSTQAKAENIVNNAGYTLSKVLLGWLAGPPPAPAGTYGDPDCVQGTLPPVDDAAYATRVSQSNACLMSDAGDTACVVCVKASCCTETFACVGERTCTCLMASRMGIPWPEDVPCGEDDAVYTTETSCLAEHCAHECPLR
jgi:hypothetical protein